MLQPLTGVDKMREKAPLWSRRSCFSIACSETRNHAGRCVYDPPQCLNSKPWKFS